MKLDDASGERKVELAMEAASKGRIFFSKDNYAAEFNRGCDHVVGLLGDAFLLFQSSSFATAVFLAITAIEEIAKLEIALYRREGRTVSPKTRREDLLFNHKAKHSIALQEVIAIGARLPKAIGEERVRELLDMAESGELLAIREASLYTDVVNNAFVSPTERFSKKEAREFLLLALEVWDDRLLGSTNHTYELDKRMMEIFEHVENS